MAFWSVLAEDDGRALDVDVDRGPLPVPVSESDLADLLDVLIDNVFAHTPDGTGFAVTLRAGDGHLRADGVRRRRRLVGRRRSRAPDTPGSASTSPAVPLRTAAAG